MKECPDIKVGDVLAFRAAFGRSWRLEKVERITPSGRIKCGHTELNPDLTIRGADRFGPYRAEIPTPEIIHKVEADRLAHIVNKADFEKLTPDDLKVLSGIFEHMREAV